jgi:hypothetical protein
MMRIPRIRVRDDTVLVAGAIGVAAAGLGIAALGAGALVLRDTFWGDPTIYLAFAQNAARGLPFTFNPPEFSSGVASVLWELVLALPLAVGTGVAGAKVCAAAFVLIGFLTTLWAAARLTGSWSAAAIGSLFIVPGLAFYGVLLYDSGLVVTLIAASLLIGHRVASRPGAMSRADVLFLGAAWTALPLARPECALLVLLELLALAATGSRGRIAVLVALALVAAFPAAVYYGYSQVTLGSYSVSNATRTMDQRAGAVAIGPLLYSPAAAEYLWSIAIPLAISVPGIWAWLHTRPDRWLGWYTGGAIVIWSLVLVFYPVTLYVPRYFLLAAPFVVAAIAKALTMAPARPMIRAFAWSLGFVVLLSTVATTFLTAVDASHAGYAFDVITERVVIDRVNGVAIPGDRVLAYEVQDRWSLRDDVDLLAVNGITDGKVAPFIRVSDMAGFLKSYRPSLWIADDPIHQLPYTRGTMLDEAMTRLEAGAASTSIDGVRFEVVQRNAEPVAAGFAGWRLLIRLSYSRASDLRTSDRIDHQRGDREHGFRASANETLDRSVPSSSGYRSPSRNGGT